ncbi:MAG: hypothetical protein ABIQ95_07905 [Bdellovibrionia bacterium]
MKYILAFIAFVMTIFGLAILWQYLEVENIKRKTSNLCNSLLVGFEEKQVIELAKKTNSKDQVRTKSDENYDVTKFIFSGTAPFHGVCTVTFKDKKVIKSLVSYTD